MNIRIGAIAATAVYVLMACGARADQAATFFSDYSDYSEEGKSLLDKLHPQTGRIDLPNGLNLDLKDKFYFLNTEDSRVVLVDAWGNPPDTTQTTAGMIFPARLSPLVDNVWGIEVRPDPIGYVNDVDAVTIDYDELLKSMQADEEAGNPDREKAGYEPIKLIGWAKPPTYDSVNKRLYWAKELQFGNRTPHTLNYDIRFLNRRGVVVMSYIASMDELPQVDASLPDVLNTVSFDEGMRYSDYVPDVDEVAAIGVGGLIAGQVAAKTGLLVVMIALLKKFGILLIAPVVWVWRKIRGKA
jgi:uncharacterized membrane-anchored protein